MTTLEPFNGSLLRLAVTTVAVMAVFACLLAVWQDSHAGRLRRFSQPGAHPVRLSP